jgi:hypothetical protein
MTLSRLRCVRGPTRDGRLARSRHGARAMPAFARSVQRIDKAAAIIAAELIVGENSREMADFFWRDHAAMNGALAGWGGNSEAANQVWRGRVERSATETMGDIDDLRLDERRKRKRTPLGSFALKNRRKNSGRNSLDVSAGWKTESFSKRNRVVLKPQIESFSKCPHTGGRIQRRPGDSSLRPNGCERPPPTIGAIRPEGVRCGQRVGERRRLVHRLRYHRQCPQKGSVSPPGCSEATSPVTIPRVQGPLSTSRRDDDVRPRHLRVPVGFERRSLGLTWWVGRLAEAAALSEHVRRNHRRWGGTSTSAAQTLARRPCSAPSRRPRRRSHACYRPYGFTMMADKPATMNKVRPTKAAFRYHRKWSRMR